MHGFTGRFKTIHQLKQEIMKEFEDEISTECCLDVGYFEGKQSLKIWLMSDRDMKSMYERVKKDDVFLWVQVEGDGEEEENEPARKKRRNQKEDSVDEIFSVLKKKHETSFSSPQLKLWARMLHCGSHDDYDTPPQVPMITGNLPQYTRKKSPAQAAAEAVAKVLSPKPATVSCCSSSDHGSAHKISPVKSTELRMQNLQQLRVLTAVA